MTPLKPIGSRWLYRVVIGFLAAGVVVLGGLMFFSRIAATSAAEHAATTYHPPALVLPTPAYGDVLQKIARLPKGSHAFFFGDSYVDGYGAEINGRGGFAPRIASRYGWTYSINGVGGSGYVNTGPSGKDYLSRLNDLAPFNADVILLEGGLNDETQAPASVVAAADKVVTRLRQLSPSAQILMIGPVNPYMQPEPSLAAVDRALRQFAADERLPYADAYLYNIAEYTQNDKRHPDDAGYAMLARRLEGFIGACVLL